MCQKIGPFYVIDNIIYANGVAVSEGEKYGDFITTSYSHLSFWDDVLSKKYKGFDFDYFERGRVVYNSVRDLFVIYVDKDINGKHIQQIKEEFGITAMQTKIEYDEHYQCRLCNEGYIEFLLDGGD